MYILGLATMRESAAALIKDGVLVAAIEEERLTRVKHEGCFPLRAIRFCLEKEGITLADIDHIGIYWQPWRMGIRAKEVTKSILKQPDKLKQKLTGILQEFSFSGAGQNIESEGSWLELFFAKKILQENFGSFKAKVHYLDHHKCHIASSFYVSPFDEATILIFDGAGESFSTTIAVGKGEKIKILRSISWPHSLGHFYSSFTGFLGFEMNDGEYKMMGLAPQGKPRFLEQIRREYLVTDKKGSFRLNTRFLDYHLALEGKFSSNATALLGEPRRNDNEPFTDHHADIASSAQAAFDEVCLDLASWAYEAGGKKKNICIAGGCGLNGIANGKLLRQGMFENIYIPPAPHDAGCSVGAAFLIHHQVLRKPRQFTMGHAQFGPEFSNEQIREALIAKGLDTAPLLDENSLLDKCSKALTEGKVLAWFQGRMEFGPRALGNRSFLADPRSNTIKDTINEKIKKRELFRPFAPSIKEECCSDYFEVDQNCPFMNIVVPVRPEKIQLIPAVTHVDGSARVQTVNRDINPRYWKLIDKFESLTKVPILLNTSFNIQEPVVCSPEEAIATFLKSRVDALAIGDYWVTREDINIKE